MIRLAELAQGRDNNFNLIRMVAACLVLFTHSFALVAGKSGAEPDLYNMMTLGTLAVHVFFVASGFLITASLLARQNLAAFIWARVLRIYPALVVVLLLSVFVLGACMSVLPLSEYLTHTATYTYLKKGLTLFGGVSYKLPGVFESVPFAKSVNGSLWTLPYEVRSYAVIAACGALLLFIPQRFRTYALMGLVVAVYVFSTGITINEILEKPSLNPKPTLYSLFFAGSLFYLLREKVPMSLMIFVLMAALLGLSLLGIFVYGKALFCITYLFILPYLLLYIAYVPKGVIRQYNKLGDYSYGMYIYAFPVQQTLVALNPAISTGQMIIYSAAISLCFAVLSWYLIEKPALKYKKLPFNWRGFTFSRTA